MWRLNFDATIDLTAFVLSTNYISFIEEFVGTVDHNK